MTNLTWPAAFVLVFGGVPLVVSGVAVLCVYPAIVLPVLVTVLGAVWLGRNQARRDGLAARADQQHAVLAALVAAPLPDLPTVPIRRAFR